MEVDKTCVVVSVGDVNDTPVIRSRYCPRVSAKLECTTPSLTKQDAKDECDINLIIKRHDSTGLWGNSLKPSTRIPQFVDIANAPDAITAHNLFIQAENAFMELPADVRKQFNNSPHELIAFISEDSNYERALSLGLVEKRPEPKIEPVEVPPVVSQKPTV